MSEHKAKDTAKQKEADASAKEKTTLMQEFLSWVEVIVVAVVLALFIDGVIIINATVPSGSMETTIMTGDRVLGTRFSYWGSAAPKRGDIVVFHYPIDDAIYSQKGFFSRLIDNITGKHTKYIKRVIGLPGETVEIREGQVVIDGEPLEETYINGRWMIENDGYTFHVPEGEYLMLGDYRNDSSDSRYWAKIAILEGLAETKEEAEAFRYVPENKILGKAYICYWPFSDMGSLYS